MVTGSVIVGRAEAGEMVCGPAPGMLKLMRSTTVASLLLALVSWMAALKVHSRANLGPTCTKTPVKHEPSPGLLSTKSRVELTVKVAAWAGLAVNSNRL